MTADSSGLTDEVTAELNPADSGPDYGPQAEAIPARPAAGANHEAWAAYVVALGLHPDQVDDYDTGELIRLADRFGG